MAEQAHPADHEPRTQPAPLGAPVGWAEYSPMRRQWRSLTACGRLAYHATADDAERHLSQYLPPRYRPSPRP